MTVGVVVHFLFFALGLIPDLPSAEVAEVKIETNYKLFIDVLATGRFFVLYWLHREDRMNAGSGQSASTAD